MKKVSIIFLIVTALSLVSGFCFAEILTPKMQAAKFKAINSLQGKKAILKNKPYSKFNNNINDINKKDKFKNTSKNVQVIKSNSNIKKSNFKLDAIQKESKIYIKSVEEKIKKLDKLEMSLD